MEKRGCVAWFTWGTNKTSRQEACTTYVGRRRPSVLPKERRHWGLSGRMLEAQAKLVSLVGSTLQMETQPEWERERAHRPTQTHTQSCCAHTQTHIHTQTHKHSPAAHTQTRIHTHRHTQSCTHIHARTQTHTHRHTVLLHTHTQSFLQQVLSPCPPPAPSSIPDGLPPYRSSSARVPSTTLCSSLSGSRASQGAQW